MPPKNLIRISQSMRGSSVRRIAVFAVSALNGSPSWNLTPSRSLNRQVRGSICCQEVASLGVMLPSLGSISVRVSVTFCLTIRPTFERLASQGSMMSGSSESTIVISPGAAASAWLAGHAIPVNAIPVNAIHVTASGSAAKPAALLMRILVAP